MKSNNSTSVPGSRKKTKEPTPRGEAFVEARNDGRAEARHESSSPSSLSRGSRTAGSSTVETVMTRNVRTCKPHDSLQTAAQIMWDGDCGCVPVVNDEGRLISIITDRDICMAACLQNRPLREIPVSAAMSKSIWTVGPDDSIAQALRELRSRKVRRLPVVDREDRLLGILSLNDLARQAGRDRRKRDRQVGDAEVGETLSAICAKADESAAPEETVESSLVGQA